MQVSVTKESLINALQHVLKAVSASSPIPILTGINIQAYVNELVFTASNTSMTIQYKIPRDSRLMTVQRTGGIVVPAPYFYEMIRKLDAGFICFEIKDPFILTITSGNSQIRLNGMDSAEFPSTPHVEYHPVLKLKMSTALLISSIKQVATSVSTSETRPVLTGVCLECRDESLHLIATDGIRFASRTIHIEHKAAEVANVIIPGKNLYEAAKILGNEDDTTEIVIGGNQIRFTANHLQIQSALIEGTYPSLKNVIPSSYVSEVITETASLLNAIERATVLASENIVRIVVASNKLALLSKKAEIGDIQDEVVLKEMNGEPFVVSLNGKYFVSILGCMDSEYVRLKYAGKLSPLIIQPFHDPSSTLFLLTPVRTANG